MHDEPTVGEVILRGQRPSLRVSKVGALLEVDVSTVYKLIRDGSLEAHRVGQRGIRIFADSLRHYQATQTIGSFKRCAERLTAKSPTALRIRNPAHSDALDFLKEAGIL